MTRMVKTKVTLSIDPKAYERLKVVSKMHGRSKSNMVETMTYIFYNHKDKIKELLLREELDKL